MPAHGVTHPAVLVVDDFEDSRALLRRLLEVKGYRVVEAADGQEAVDVARRDCLALVLMDLRMPRMSGLEATRRIRDLEEHSGLPVVAITAFDDFGVRAEALAAGCDAYLRKLIEPVEFNRVLRRLLWGW